MVVRIDYIEVPKIDRYTGKGKEEVLKIIDWAKIIGAKSVVIESKRDAIPFWRRMGFDVYDQGSKVSTGILELNRQDAKFEEGGIATDGDENKAIKKSLDGMTYFKQEKDNTCSVACLRMALSKFMDKVPSEEDLAIKLKTNDKTGTHPDDIRRVAKDVYGINVLHGENGNLEYLDKLILDGYIVLLSVSIAYPHSVVYIGSNGKYSYFNDPFNGEKFRVEKQKWTSDEETHPNFRWHVRAADFLPERDFSKEESNKYWMAMKPKSKNYEKGGTLLDIQNEKSDSMNKAYLMTQVFESGGEIEEEVETPLEELKRYVEISRNVERFKNYIIMSENVNELAAVLELVPSDKAGNEKKIKAFYKIEKHIVKERRRKNHEYVMAMTADKNVSAIEKLALEMSDDMDRQLKERFGDNYEQGGETSDYGKVASASSRFRPKETIFFDPPLVGKNGAKLVSYTWSWTPVSDVNREGEEVMRRISDWTQAELSVDTGRSIVHQYTIQEPNGVYKTVSSESVPILLGYVDRKAMTSFPNLTAAAKTLAKQQMQLAIMSAQEAEYNALKKRFQDADKPEVKKIEEPVEFVRERMKKDNPDHDTYSMGDVWYRQDNPYRYGSTSENGKHVPYGYPTKETIEQLTYQWVAKRIEENGGIYPRGIVDLRTRIVRQERKLKQILEQENKGSFARGGVLPDDKKEIYGKWKNLVNMSKSELEKFYNSDEGKEAGLSEKEADKLGIHSGRESARWIMRMKDTPHSDWTPAMWDWSNRQISFVSRMSKNKGDLYDDNGNKTRKHTSLLIWGHNPRKMEFGGSIGTAINLYHGTSKENAQELIKNGWQPKGFVGGNMGQGKYLYTSTVYEDALWFANESGNDTVVLIKDVPISIIMPDPEDEAGYTVQELLEERTDGMPAKFVITQPIGGDKMTIVNSQVIYEEGGTIVAIQSEKSEPMQKAYLMTLEEYLRDVAPVLKAYKDFLKKNKYFVSVGYGSLPQYSYPELKEKMERAESIEGAHSFNYQTSVNARYGKSNEEIFDYDWKNRQQGVDYVIEKEVPASVLEKKNELLGQLKGFFGEKMFNSISLESDLSKSNKRAIRYAIDYGIYEKLLKDDAVTMEHLNKVAESAGVKIPKKISEMAGNAASIALAKVYDAIHKSMPSINRDVLTKLIEEIKESFKPFEKEIFYKTVESYKRRIEMFLAEKEMFKQDGLYGSIPFADKIFTIGKKENRQIPQNTTDRQGRMRYETVSYIGDLKLVDNWEANLNKIVQEWVDGLKASLIGSIISNLSQVTEPIVKYTLRHLGMSKIRQKFDGVIKFDFANGSDFILKTQAVLAGIGVGGFVQQLHFRYLSDFMDAHLADGTTLPNPSLAKIIEHFSDKEASEQLFNPYIRVSKAQTPAELAQALYDYMKPKSSFKNVRLTDNKEHAEISYKPWDSRRMGGEYIGFTKNGSKSMDELRKKATDFLDKVKAPKPTTQMKEGGNVDGEKIGGNYIFPNETGSFTSVTVMPVDENLRGSKDFFTVKVEVRAKEAVGDLQHIAVKPLKTYPMEKYNAFMEDLKARGGKKVSFGHS